SIPKCSDCLLWYGNIILPKLSNRWKCHHQIFGCICLDPLLMKMDNTLHPDQLIALPKVWFFRDYSLYYLVLHTNVQYRTNLRRPNLRLTFERQKQLELDYS